MQIPKNECGEKHTVLKITGTLGGANYVDRDTRGQISRRGTNIERVGTRPLAWRSRLPRLRYPCRRTRQTPCGLLDAGEAAGGCPASS
jgi:hypothetical protein